MNTATLLGMLSLSEFFTKYKISLCSSSSSRLKILKDVKLKPYTIINPDIDEKAIRFDDPFKLTSKLAHEKLNNSIQKWKSKNDGDSILISSDIVVYYNKQIYEKPTNIEQARKWIQSYLTQDMPVYAVSSIVIVNTKTG